MDEERAKSIYVEVRREMFCPPTSLTFMDNEKTPFFIENGRVNVNLKLIPDDIFCRSIMRHELGHIKFMPQSVENHIKYMNIVSEEFVKKNIRYSNHTVTMIANLFFDFVVDRIVMDKYGDDIKHREITVMKTMKPGKNQVNMIRRGYYNRLIGEDIENVPKKEDRTSKKIYDIIYSLLPSYYKIRLIARLFANQDFAKKESDLIDMLEAISDTLNLGRISVKEAMEGDDSVRRALEDSVDALKNGNGTSDDGISELMGDIAKACKVKLEEYWYYKALARRNIKFRLKSLRPAKGKIEKGCLEPWGPDDDPEDIDISESLSETPVLIPEVTTRKYENKKGYENSFSVPDVHLVLDTSGSMDRKMALVTVFSMIEACRIHKTKSSVMLFSDDVYYTSGFSSSYDDIERKIYEKYISGGTVLRVPAEKTAKMCKTGGKLIIFISDFYGIDDDDENACIRRLSDAKRNNHVYIIKMRGRDKKLENFASSTVRHIEDLDSVIVRALNSVIM